VANRCESLLNDERYVSTSSGSEVLVVNRGSRPSNAECWARATRIESWLAPHRVNPAFLAPQTRVAMQKMGDDTLVRHLFASFRRLRHPQVLRHDALELAFRNDTLYLFLLTAWYDVSLCSCDPPIVSLLRSAAGISLQIMRRR
jgi:hypothetical protein